MPNTVTDKLKHGLKVGETVHREFVMREALAEDLFEAEKLVATDNALAFQAALMCRQLERIGSFSGPFTVEMIGKLSQGDYTRLRKAQVRLEVLGELEEGGGSSATPSS